MELPVGYGSTTKFWFSDARETAAVKKQKRRESRKSAQERERASLEEEEGDDERRSSRQISDLQQTVQKLRGSLIYAGDVERYESEEGFSDDDLSSTSEEAYFNEKAPSLCCLTANSPFRTFVWNSIVNTKLFDNFILIAIVFNSVTLAIASPSVLENDDMAHALDIAECLFQSIFTVELVLKVIALGLVCHPGAYLRSPSNALDAFVVATGFLSGSCFFPQILGANISAIRLLRVLRPLRAVARVKDLRVIVSTLVLSIPGVRDVAALLAFLVLLAAVFGVELFSGVLSQRCYYRDGNSSGWRLVANDTDVPCSTGSYGRPCESNGLLLEQRCMIDESQFHPSLMNFDLFPTAVLLAVRVVSLDDWPFLSHQVQQAAGQYAGIYFFVITAFGTLFCVNLFLAVVSEKYIAVNDDISSTIVKEEEKGPEEEVEPSNAASMILAVPVAAFNAAVGAVEGRLTNVRLWVRVWLCDSKRKFGPAFNTLMLCVTLFNVVSLGARHEGEPQELAEVADIINYSAGCIFFLELLLRLFGLGFKGYMTNRMLRWSPEEGMHLEREVNWYNALDAALVLISIPDFVSTEGSFLSSFRIFRVARLMRVVTKWRQMSMVMSAVFKAAKSCFSLLMLLSLLVFVYGVMGLQLFAGKMVKEDGHTRLRQNFDSTWEALLTAFIIITGDSWTYIMSDTVTGVGTWAPIFYFISLFILGNYLFLNLFVSILLDKFTHSDSEDATPPTLFSVHDKAKPLPPGHTIATVDQVHPVVDKIDVPFGCAARIEPFPCAVMGPLEDVPLVHVTYIEEDIDMVLIVAPVDCAEDVAEKVERGGQLELSASGWQVKGKDSPREETPGSDFGVGFGDRQVTTMTIGSDSSKSPTSEVCKDFKRKSGQPGSFRFGPQRLSTTVCRTNNLTISMGSYRGYRGIEKSEKSQERSFLSPGTTPLETPLDLVTPQSPSPRQTGVSPRPRSPAVLPAPRSPAFLVDAEHQHSMSFTGGIPVRKRMSSNRHTPIKKRQSGDGQELQNTSFRLVGSMRGRNMAALPPLARRGPLRKSPISKERRTSKSSRSRGMSLVVSEGPPLPSMVLEPGRRQRWMDVPQTSCQKCLSCATGTAEDLEEEADKLRLGCSFWPRTDPRRLMLARMVFHPLFVGVVLFINGLNFAFLSATSNYGHRDFLPFQLFITVAFFVEGIFKCFALGPKRWLDKPWDWIDLAVTLTSIFFLLWAPLYAVTSLRVVKMLCYRTSVRSLVAAMFHASMTVVYVQIGAVMVLFMFAVLGVYLLGGRYNYCTDPTVQAFADCKGFFEMPVLQADGGFTTKTMPRKINRYESHFDHVPRAMYTLLEVATGDSWSTIMFAAIDSNDGDRTPTRNAHPEYALFFVVVMIVAGFFWLNVFVSTLTALATRSKDAEAERVLSVATTNEMAWVDAQRFITHITTLPVPRKPRGPGVISKLKLHCYNLALSELFDNFITVVIVLNVLIMCTKHRGQPEAHDLFIIITDTIFFAIFMFEFLIKMAGLTPKIYLAFWFNRFDCLLLFISATQIAYGGQTVTVLRALRLARLLRLSRKMRNLSRLFTTLVWSLPALVDVICLLIATFFVFAVAGTQLFRGIQHTSWGLNSSSNFHSVGASIKTLYEVATLVRWRNIRSGTMITPGNSDCSYELGNCGQEEWIVNTYFNVFLLVGSLVLFNLFIAIIMDQFPPDNIAQRRKIGLVQSGGQTLWGAADPSATGLLAVSSSLTLTRMLLLSGQWECFIRNLEDGFTDILTPHRILKRLNIPVMGGVYVRHADWVQALSRLVWGVSDERALWMSKTPGVPPQNCDVRYYKAHHVMAAVRMQRNWRKCRHALSRSQAVMNATDTLQDDNNDNEDPGQATLFAALRVAASSAAATFGTDAATPQKEAQVFGGQRPSTDVPMLRKDKRTVRSSRDVEPEEGNVTTPPSKECSPLQVRPRAS
eukprot:Hpha_TRINITY_DN12419_c0_g1::TRINITY_DN12419_c0_g1_i1::g.43016::m.43016/K04850/CACNA1C; voltage-dependent calcium channel L type alpha-1C